ncbi:DUF418 domain-containing protein [Thalassotalea ganghwensis]
MSQPVKPTKDRIIALDGLRGFALCGIIFANLVSFAGFYSLSFSQVTQLAWWDRAVLFAIDFLIEGKFYSIFAILFGAGFALQYERFHSKKQAFSLFWLKRMAVLFAIGICHMYFIWHGDILTLYSLLGLCLLCFITLNQKSLLKWVIALLIMPLLIHFILMHSHSHSFWRILSDSVINLRQTLGYTNIDLLTLRTSDNFYDVFWGNIFSAIPRPLAYLKTGRPFQVLGQFLLGVYLVRHFILAKAPLPTTKQLFSLLLIGALLNAVYAYIKAITGSPFSINLLGLVQGFVYHIGCTTMALAYIGLLYRLWLNQKADNHFSRLGKMALTGYLMQTSVCVLLFYGYGVGLMGQVPFYTIVFFGIGMLMVQVAAVRYWLKRFTIGPMEFIWRRFV